MRQFCNNEIILEDFHKIWSGCKVFFVWIINFNYFCDFCSFELKLKVVLKKKIVVVANRPSINVLKSLLFGIKLYCNKCCRLSLLNADCWKSKVVLYQRFLQWGDYILKVFNVTCGWIWVILASSIEKTQFKKDVVSS